MPEPVVSIIVPCRNEKDSIQRCIASLQAQISPVGECEIIVVDGMSDDGSHAILKRIAEHSPLVRVIENPKRITAAAMNIGIAAAQGRYVAILGAHTEYAQDYIQRCVETLEEHPEVCCAGGPIMSRGTTMFGRAVAVAMSHPLGVGNARHRFPEYEGYAEAVCFPVFRREIFQKVGLFDEALIRNQDDDFYYRVIRSGERFFLSPRARCTYFVRETPLQLFYQYFQYGLWRVAVIRKHRRPASFRQLVPVIFLLLVLISCAVGILFRPPWGLAAAAVPTAYGSLLVSVAMTIMLRHGMMVGALFPAAAMTMHVAYGAGFLWGSGMTWKHANSTS
jgi:GT2 family glycosyltransferase